MGGKDVVLVTGSDLAEQAMVMLQGFEVVFAGRQPTEDDLIALCKRHNPVAILVRYLLSRVASLDVHSRGHVSKCHPKFFSII